MNPRQRRGVMLLVLAGLGAVGVFAAVASYVSNVRSQVTPMTSVLRVVRDVPAYRPITQDMVNTVQVPQRWVPSAAMSDPTQVQGTVADVPLTAGSFLQRGMVGPPPQLGPGQRELAILVDAETGVAGKVRPGDTVDIEATFGGTQKTPPRSSIVVPNARVLDVGQVFHSGGSAGATLSNARDVVPITFALSVQESLVLTYAESFAATVRLALVRPGEQSSVPPGQAYQQPGVGAGLGIVPTRPTG